MDYEMIFKISKDNSVSETAISFIEDVLKDDKTTDRQKMEKIITISNIALRHFSIPR